MLTSEQLLRLGALQRRLGNVQSIIGEVMAAGYPDGGSKVLSTALGMVLVATDNMAVAGDIPVDIRVNLNLLPVAPKLLEIVQELKRTMASTRGVVPLDATAIVYWEDTMFHKLVDDVVATIGEDR